MMEKISLKQFAFSSGCGGQYPREFIGRNGVVKLSEDDAEVRIAVVEGAGADLLEYLEGYHLPKRTIFSPVSKVEFAAYIGELAGLPAPGGGIKAPHPAGLENAGADGTADPAKSAGEGTFTLEAVTGDAPVISIINAICIEAIGFEASDIHIEAQAGAVQVRCRIDGMLKVIKRLDKSFFPAISNRIKIMADMNTLERRLPQDGRMTVSAGDHNVDLRVSVIPTTGGESIVLRIFNKTAKLLRPDQLGFYPPDLERIKAGLRSPWGLLLLTGPTGSGKTTTLHALLGTLPVEEMNIIALEDPVEQIIPGINQVQINDAINLSFDSMLRRVLRQDPNVIMVGEIRDRATAELALRSALTGHLILSTLHTNDSVSVIPRLCNMGIEPYLVAAVLRCSVAQRLVRKLCPLCRKAVKAKPRIRTLLKKYHIGDASFFEPAGCGDCGYTGYRGRTIVGEVLTVDPVIEEMIAGGKSAVEIGRCAGRRGMEGMSRDALRKAAQGLTSIEEIEREVLL
ncbi:MAG: GspE/PulE family protein [Treponema sp.]|jgi:general secretion pathway protein E/type IV pilus assembly protein PilB|nr:GspE/PulE family protein [Treponema sp.]